MWRDARSNVSELAPRSLTLEACHNMWSLSRSPASSTSYTLLFYVSSKKLVVDVRIDTKV